MNTQIIAIANQKGGVGKTTTCANLGIGLAQAGKKVLLIDGDPQGSLTISLGNPQPDKLPFTLSDAMGKILMDQPIRPGEGILHHAEGVDLMPADIQLSGMEVSLVNAMSRETVLRQYLDTLKGQYSHILIDCQPSLGMLTVNALAAANRIIIPVQAEYLPAKGLEQLLSTVSKVKRQINPKLQIDGILLTMVDNRTNFAKEIAALLRDTYTQRSTPTQQGTAARRDRRPACPVADRGRGMAQPTCGAGVGRSFSCGEVTAHPPPGSPRYARSRRRSAVERWTTYLSYTTRKTGGNGDAF